MSKLVRESISFERGGDPRKTMRVGKLERLKEKYDEEDLNELLMRAVRHGNLEDVKYLVYQHADTGYGYQSAAQTAIENDHLDVLKYLVEHVTNINIRKVDYLRIAAIEGYLDIAKYLVEQGVNVSGGDFSALELAAKYENLDIVKYLVEQGADISADMFVPLRWAIMNKNLEMVKFLSRHIGHIDENVKNIVLTLAKRHKHEGIINILESVLKDK